MKEDKDQWMEEVFLSMKDSKKAIPRSLLFGQIENEIESLNGSSIPMQLINKYVIVAALLLMLNIAAILYYNQNKEIVSQDVAAAEIYNESLITSYQLNY